MPVAKKTEVRYTDKPISPKHKPGGRLVVSSSLVKVGKTNQVAKLHVKRGDTVMLISGPKRDDKKRSAEIKKRLDAKNIYKGTIGKVVKVMPGEGQLIVEGVNMTTHFVRPNPMAAQTGIVKKEGPIFASKVMLYCTACKKPTRVKSKDLEKPKTANGPTRTRVCRHCSEAFDA